MQIPSEATVCPYCREDPDSAWTKDSPYNPNNRLKNDTPEYNSQQDFTSSGAAWPPPLSISLAGLLCIVWLIVYYAADLELDFMDLPGDFLPVLMHFGPYVLFIALGIWIHKKYGW